MKTVERLSIQQTQDTLRNLYDRAFQHEATYNKAPLHVFQQYMAELHRHKYQLPYEWQDILENEVTYQAQAKWLIQIT